MTIFDLQPKKQTIFDLQQQQTNTPDIASQPQVSVDTSVVQQSPADTSTSVPSGDTYNIDNNTPYTTVDTNPYAVKDENQALSNIAEGATRGTARPALGIAYLGEGIYNKLSDSNSTVVDKWIQNNEEAIKQKGLEGPALAGEIASNILLTALPGGTEASALKAGAIEGTVAGISSKGANRNDLDTALAVLTAGGGTMALQAVFNKLTGTQVHKLYSYMLDHYNLDPETVNKNYRNWLKITGEKDTIQNKIKSIVDSLGEQGANLKKMTADNPEAVKNLNATTKKIRENVDKASKTDFDAKDFAATLKQSYQDVADKYGEIKQALGSKPVEGAFENPKYPWTALDEATTGNVAELKKLIGNENDKITTGDLIEASPIINALIRRSKGRTLHQWAEVKKSVEDTLKKLLTPEEYKNWRAANADYARMSQVKDSKLGKVINQVIEATKKGKMLTTNKLFSTFKTLNEGENTFSNIKFLVGAENTAKLEKTIVNAALNSKLDGVGWESLAKNVSNNGFVTEEGKNLAKLVNTIKTTFHTDDAMRALNAKVGTNGATIATTVEGKASVWLIDKLFKIVRKNIPFSKYSMYLRKMDTLKDVLSSPTKVQEFSNLIKNSDAILDINPEEVVPELKPTIISMVDTWVKKNSAIPNEVLSDINHIKEDKFVEKYANLHWDDLQTQEFRSGMLSIPYDRYTYKTIKNLNNGYKLVKADSTLGIVDKEGKFKGILTVLDNGIENIAVDESVSGQNIAPFLIGQAIRNGYKFSGRLRLTPGGAKSLYRYLENPYKYSAK